MSVSRLYLLEADNRHVVYKDMSISRRHFGFGIAAGCLAACGRATPLGVSGEQDWMLICAQFQMRAMTPGLQHFAHAPGATTCRTRPLLPGLGARDIYPALSRVTATELNLIAAWKITFPSPPLTNVWP